MLTTDIENAVKCAVFDIEKKEMKKETRGDKLSPFPVRILRRFQNKQPKRAHQMNCLSA